MTIREILISVRLIVVNAPEGNDRCGCIEDAICRVMLGKSWHDEHQQNHDRYPLIETASNQEREGLKELPVYIVLIEAIGNVTDKPKNLWYWSDTHSKTERIALIDAAILQSPLSLDEYR